MLVLQYIFSKRINNSPKSVWALNPKVSYHGSSVDFGYQSLFKASQWLSFNQYIHWYHDGLDINITEKPIEDHYHRGVLQVGGELRSKWNSYFLNLGGLSNLSLYGSLGSSYKLSFGKKSKGTFHSRAFVNLSRGSKLPSLYQLNDSQFGNPSLAAEYSSGVEATFGFGSKFFDAQFAAYQFFLFDYIDFDLSQNRYQNLSKVRFQGLQFALSFMPKIMVANQFTLKANIQDTKNLMDSRPLAGRPRVDAKLSHSLNFMECKLMNTVHYTGERIGFSGGALSDYFLWNITAGYHWRNRVNLLLNVRNILDTPYEISPGFKQPGRNWQLSMSWKL